MRSHLRRMLDHRIEVPDARRSCINDEIRRAHARGFFRQMCAREEMRITDWIPPSTFLVSSTSRLLVCPVKSTSLSCMQQRGDSVTFVIIPRLSGLMCKSRTSLAVAPNPFSGIAGALTQLEGNLGRA
eukprot:1164772-Pleurochrysis_carterae.AAC.2